MANTSKADLIRGGPSNQPNLSAGPAKTVILVMAYSADQFFESEVAGVDELEALIKAIGEKFAPAEKAPAPAPEAAQAAQGTGAPEATNAPAEPKKPVIWINVDGPLDASSLDHIGRLFDLHHLALEDVANARQRAKFEEFGKNHFLVARMVSLTDRLNSEQLSLFFNTEVVITFQECAGGDCLDSVRERIRKKLGRVRENGADHLAYIIVDAAIDGYFPVLEELGDRLETLEDDILLRHDSRSPKRIHEIKRDIVTLRRLIWPLREAVNCLFRDTTPMVSADTRIYLRDCYDHAIRLLDLVEMYRELCSDLMDLHLSSTGNRMNEVMKVLAIITTLFIPPTFIAGIYGMNFNPEKSPLNMPELNWFFGYPMALTLMALVMAALFFWMKWKGWLSDYKSRRDN